MCCAWSGVVWGGGGVGAVCVVGGGWVIDCRDELVLKCVLVLDDRALNLCGPWALCSANELKEMDCR